VVTNEGKIIKWKKALKTNVKWALCMMINEGTKFT
jgi:hypothetical protein